MTLLWKTESDRSILVLVRVREKMEYLECYITATRACYEEGRLVN